MNLSNIFPVTPKVTDADRKRLDKAGYTKCWNTMNKVLKVTDPSAADLKKCFLIELERSPSRKPMLKKFLVRIQKKEREEIMERVLETPEGKALSEETDMLC